jgi:hypothetical protein
VKRLALTLTALLALPTAALADELSWRLDQTWRYSLEAQEAPGTFPAPLQIAPQRLVSLGDLRDGRVPGWPVGDAGDLVWHYALLLPAAEVPKKKAKVALDDSFPWSGGGLAAKGEHQLRRKGKRLQITTRAELSALAKTATLRGGTLEVQRVFDLKQGRLLQASYRLELTAQVPDQQPVQGAWAGTIGPDQALDLASRDFHGEVQAAIGRATTWLKRQLGPRLQGYKKQGADHYKLGRIALPVFALLRAGVDPAELNEYFAWMRSQPFDRVYSVALYLMVLEARSIRRRALPPVGGTRSVAAYDRDPIPPADLAEIQRALAWLLGAHGDGWWSYGAQMEDGIATAPLGHDGKTVPKRGDRSNSQFAILALHSALAAGVEVPREVWDALLKELLGSQQKDGPAVSLADQELAPTSPMAWDARDHLGGGTVERGQGQGLSSEEREQALARGWAYSMVSRTGASAAYGSMSAAGLSSVAVVLEALRHLDGLTPEQDREGLLSLRDGLGWFADNYDVARNPGRGASHYYYYLYSLEKAMDLSGVERLAGHEWWREGAATLLQRQGQEGAWEKQVEATSFALLFLNRATLPARLDVEAIGPVATGGEDPALWDQVAVEGVGKVRARQVLRALLRASGRELKSSLELAKSTLAAMDVARAPRLLPELIALMEGGPKDARRWAARTCRDLTGSDAVAEVSRFAEAHELLYGLTESGQAEAGSAAAIRVLGDEPPPQLERAALRTLSRLGGVEGAVAVIKLLGAPTAQRRELAWQTLVALIGERRPFDPRGPASQRQDQLAEWKAYWLAEGEAHLTREQVRRLIVRLGAGDEEAEQALREVGEPATRQLIDALRSEGTREQAQRLLQAITDQDFPAELEPWLDWWEKTNR